MTSLAATYAQQATLIPDESAPFRHLIEMPAEPAWTPAPNGLSQMALTIAVPGAAACRLTFEYLSLGEGESMNIVAQSPRLGLIVHGPYLGHGPVRQASFSSLWLPGHTFQVTATAKSGPSFPFSVHTVDCMTPEQIAASGVQFRTRYTPSVPSSTMRSSVWVDGTVLPSEESAEGTTVEGDIIVPSEGAKSSGERSSIQIAPSSRFWPGFKIPYEIGRLGVYDWESFQVTNAINYWNARFPGLLIPRTSAHTDYIYFTEVAGVCQSSVGRVAGGQTIELDLSCSETAVIHEIGHAIGLWHEQSRQDRDEYVKVNYDNIETGKSHNFDIKNTSWGRHYGSYDYGSIMHYSAFAFSSNGKRTMEPLKPMPAGVTMGMATVASANDLASVRDLICRQWFKAPAFPLFDWLGDSVSVQIILPSYCSWTISESATWLTVSKTSGSGTTTVTFTAPYNHMAMPRQANVTINGKVVVVKQEGREL